MTPARLAAYRLKIAKGIHPAPEAVAKKILEVAEKPFPTRMHELRKRYLLRRLGIAI